jgi:dihydroorotate dehydrogenase
MLHKPFYDPEKTYNENLKDGPFGSFSDGKILKEKGEPKYNFFGHKVYSPFGIPAGPLINGKFVEAALRKGFDIVVYKTVRSHKYPCHKWPNILHVDIKGNLTLKKAEGKLIANHNFNDPLSITNSFGVPSQESKIWQKDIRKVLKNVRPGQIVVGGFQGTKSTDGNIESYINDFCLTAKLLKEVGVKVFEVNFSCPNEGTNNLLCFDIERSYLIAKAIKNEIGDLPLIVKIAYFKDDELLKNFIKKLGKTVDGISAINTIASTIVDESGKQALPGLGRERSGVCGHSIKWAGLDMVKRLNKLRNEFGYKYTIIGVGGVMSEKDFKEYRKSGADIVMSATGAMWNPYLAEEIKKL